MGLGAHNIGAPETQFSPEQLRGLAAEIGNAWLSTHRDGPTPLRQLIVSGKARKLALNECVE
jgi:hypothetical protein